MPGEVLLLHVFGQDSQEGQDELMALPPILSRTATRLLIQTIFGRRVDYTRIDKRDPEM